MGNEPQYGHGKSLDPAKRAEELLERMYEDDETDSDITVLDKKLQEKRAKRRAREEEAARVAAAAVEPEVTVSEARSAERILADSERRDDVRLLLFTRDEQVLTEGSNADVKLRELAGLFGELHVIVLVQTRKKTRPSERRGHNMWVYHAPARFWWSTSFKARSVARAELVFGDGFRPDLVIGADPFEAGLAAVLTGDAHKRPVQVQVDEDFFSPFFKHAAPHNRWRRYVARYVLKRTDCVRTTSAYLRDRIKEAYGSLENATEVLPVYYNLTAWRDAPKKFELRQRYPQFSFFILHVTSMDDQANSEAVITGLTRILRRYKTVGLILLGNGPKRAELEKMVASQKIESNVVFVDTPADVASYMKSANVLMHTAARAADDASILHAAAVGLPVISSVEGLAGELFIENQSALLCPLDSPQCFGQKLNTLLSDNHLRTVLAINARDTVFERVEQDYSAYLDAYRSSMERCLIEAS